MTAPELPEAALAWLCWVATGPAEVPPVLAPYLEPYVQPAASWVGRWVVNAAGAAVVVRLLAPRGARLAQVGRWLAYHLEHGGITIRPGRAGALHVVVELDAAPLAPIDAVPNGRGGVYPGLVAPPTFDWHRVRADLVARHLLP